MSKTLIKKTSDFFEGDRRKWLRAWELVNVLPEIVYRWQSGFSEILEQEVERQLKQADLEGLSCLSLETGHDIEKRWVLCDEKCPMDADGYPIGVGVYLCLDEYTKKDGSLKLSTALAEAFKGNRKSRDQSVYRDKLPKLMQSIRQDESYVSGNLNWIAIAYVEVAGKNNLGDPEAVFKLRENGKTIATEVVSRWIKVAMKHRKELKNQL